MAEPAPQAPTDPAPTEPAPQAPVDPQRAPEDHAPTDPAPQAPVDRAPVDPQQSEPRPSSLLARIRLFFYRTTLGRTRRDKNDV